MKVFLSPAKRLNLEKDIEWQKTSKPKFIKDADYLMEVLREKSPQDLKGLMKISDDIAEMNFERNQNWSKSPKEENTFQAGLMFDGEVYRGLRNAKFDEKALKYLDNNVYILSGLYGILSPMDGVMPYRLEMGTKLKTEDAKDLHSFWKEKLTDFVNKNTKKDEILLDLSSKEYMGALDKKNLKGKLIDVKFKDYKNGKLKQINVYFKKARGAMAHYCAEIQAETIDDLKKFEGMGYAYDDNLSSDNELIFVR